MPSTSVSGIFFSFVLEQVVVVLQRLSEALERLSITNHSEEPAELGSLERIRPFGVLRCVGQRQQKRIWLEREKTK
ncbi:hypothetical protein RJT34_33314 [Clitoria ternatea]|uniref:Secreted protein n=1 Tax=Clitoria ternatea TaxID=43366 RepID=A0AAN9IAB7_CLITE